MTFSSCGGGQYKSLSSITIIPADPSVIITTTKQFTATSTSADHTTKCTVTNDVPSGDLAISRGKQRNLKGYANKIREKKAKK